MRRVVVILLQLVFCACGVHAQRNDSVTVAADSSNFVTASILILEPMNKVYSVFGHSAFRMECPSASLDYVFTFESDPGVSGFITFFAGKAKATFVAVPTEVFLKDMQKEHRGVKQYELNLTHHEKQELWRCLDKDMMEGNHRKFNLLLNNCVSMTVLKIHQSCIGERLEWAPWQGTMLLNNGDLVRHNARRSAWAEFLFVTFLGTGYDDYYDQELRLCPEILIDELCRASFVNLETGEKRPVMTDSGKELLPEYKSLKEHTVTPALLFGALLLLVCLLTLAEWAFHWRRSARWMDAILFIMQSLLGIVLVYITFVSEIFGLLWNWYLIPLNPLPLVLWICFRKRKGFGKVYLFYAIVLLLFLLLTPFVSQLDVEHQLITAMLAVRCGSNYLAFKQNLK
ncbi:MAG: DUF4105 domain-containing protein [Prevotella sp.]|nr:DUF4105 domain-containing protein [Prevotella sp.]